jgi:hypothetical protein
LDGKSVAQKNTNNAFPHSSKKMIWGLLGVTSVHGHHAAAGHGHHGHQSGLFGVDSRAGGRRHRGLGRGLVLDAAHGDISFGGVRHARCVLRTHKSLCRINHATTFVKDSGAWRGTRRVKKEEEGQNNFGFIYLSFVWDPVIKPTKTFSSPHTVARGGSASALARRSAHSEYLGTAARVVSRPCRKGIAPLCLDAE